MCEVFLRLRHQTGSRNQSRGRLTARICVVHWHLGTFLAARPAFKLEHRVEHRIRSLDLMILFVAEGILQVLFQYDVVRRYELCLEGGSGKTGTDLDALLVWRH